MIRAVIFDADGTLYGVRTAPAYSRLYRFLARRTGLSRSELKRRHTLVMAKVKHSKNPRVRTHLYAIQMLVCNRTLSKMAELEFWKGLKIVKRRGAADVLSGLRNGGYRLALASDEFRARLSEKMETALGKGWKKHFKCIVTPDSAKTMKPSGKYYRIILKKIKVRPSEAAVVGNSWEKDLLPAKNMGMTTILIGGGKRRGRPDFFIKALSSLGSVGVL